MPFFEVVGTPRTAGPSGGGGGGGNSNAPGAPHAPAGPTSPAPSTHAQRPLTPSVNPSNPGVPVVPASPASNPAEVRVVTRADSSRVEAAAASAERARDLHAGERDARQTDQGPSSERSTGDRPAGLAPGDPDQPKVLVVSLNTILLAVAIVVGLVVAVWSLAYRTGQKDERGRLPGGDSALLSGDLPSQPPVIDDPIRSGGASPTRPAQSGRNEGSAGNQTGAGSGAATGNNTRPEPITPRANDGILSTDPRQPGNNYLELGVLAYRDAAEAIAFLKTNGVDAAAVPLKGIDPAKAKANNAPCLLFLLEGVPSGSYKTSPRVGEMTSEVRRLGKVFQKEHKGASDFSEPLWRLKRN